MVLQIWLNTAPKARQVISAPAATLAAISALAASASYIAAPTAKAWPTRGWSSVGCMYEIT